MTKIPSFNQQLVLDIGGRKMTQQEHKKQIKPRLDLPSARRREPKNIKKLTKITQ